MFPHEEHLQRALRECKITKLVQDLGALYVSLVAKSASEADLETALKVDRVLQKAAAEIADLGPQPRIT